MQNLPIDQFIPEFLQKIKEKQNIILTASPGSGKTTRIPPSLISNLKSDEIIIVLVPKRIAAVSAAFRIAEENNWSVGAEVGFQVRFESRFTAATKLIFMTEGVFIKRCSDEEFWGKIRYVVLDEFHERSSNIDIALGICTEKQILGHRLKMIIMSATLNAEKLQNFLPDSELIDADIRPYKLTVERISKSQRLICDDQFSELLISSLLDGMKRTQRDVLVFLPGLSEIRFIERALNRKNIKLPIAILHGSIRLEEQRQILQYSPERRIILSTNIAESSVTIPSVDLVIDSGLVKKSIVEEKIGFRRLEIARISKFSATQRAGRAARTGDGLCIQLWHDSDERSMPEQIEPEILTGDLTEETLTVLALGIKNPENFSWLDRPKKSFEKILIRFKQWGLIDGDHFLTAKGKKVQHCPLDIERSVLFVESGFRGHQRSAAQFLAFIESTDFDKLNEQPDITNLPLNDMGQKIKRQLENIQFQGVKATDHSDFKSDLADIFLEFFPEKIAKLKDARTAVSSLGRGVEPASYLTKNANYLLMISGREISSAITKLDYAVTFTEKEFEVKFARFQKVVTNYGIDFEKMKVFKLDVKYSGPFKNSESPRNYSLNSSDLTHIQQLFRENFSKLLRLNESYLSFLERISFLNRKKDIFNISDFLIDDLEQKILESCIESITDLDNFREIDFVAIALQFLPEETAYLLNKMPSNLKLPNGRVVKIDYVCEQAPKVSARVQDYFGLNQHPTICDGKIPIIVEMLAPNNRPTQTTGQLDRFWKNGYFELRKELRARYPKHSWPDNPELKESIVVKKVFRPEN